VARTESTHPVPGLSSLSPGTNRLHGSLSCLLSPRTPIGHPVRFWVLFLVALKSSLVWFFFPSEDAGRVWHDGGSGRPSMYDRGAAHYILVPAPYLLRIFSPASRASGLFKSNGVQPLVVADRLTWWLLFALSSSSQFEFFF